MGTAVAVGVIAMLALFLGGGSGGGGGGTDPTPGGGDKPTPGGSDKPKPKPGGDKPKPSGPGKGPKPKGRGYGGGQWGDGKLPPGWDWGGNLLWISPSCDMVAEGALFMPIANRVSISDENTPTLEAALKLRSGPNPNSTDKRTYNQVYGFIDYLLDTEGYQQPEDVVARIFSEVAPMCAAVDPVQWGAPLRDWYDSFLDRVSEYVESQATGIPFEPEN